MLNNKAVALVTVLIFIILMLMVVGAVLAIMTSQARLTEHQIRRVKAFYTAEAGLQQALEDLRKGVSSGPWSVTENDQTAQVNLNTNNLTSSVDYTRQIP